jgi:hypothetical protein
MNFAERVTRFGTWTVHAQIRFQQRFPHLDPDFELMQSIGHPISKKRLRKIIAHSPQFQRRLAKDPTFDLQHYFQSPNRVIFVMRGGRVITAMAETYK